MIRFVYFFVKIFIDFYKWIELPILRFFSGYVEQSVRKKLGSVGIIVEPLERSNKNHNDQLVTSTKYDRLCRLQRLDSNLFTNVANRGYIALGESYMNGTLKFTDDENGISEFAERCMTNDFHRYYYNTWNSMLHYLEYDCINLQSPSRAWEVGKKHYDLGNEFFKSFLDTSMQYSCAYWSNADDLESAQINKLDLIARKLHLKRGMRVLDIGCGWGTLCKYLAQNYGVECVGVTVSNEGYQYAQQLCTGLSVQIFLEDYRKMDQKFDRIVCIEMFEHVGFHNHRDFFEVVHRCLKDDGIFLLHTTIITDKSIRSIDPWIHTYLFPNISPAYVSQIGSAIDNLFVIEDWHNLGLDFFRTFIAWRKNFILNWPKISQSYDEKFYRMWIWFFSLYSTGFKCEKLQLAHIVFTKLKYTDRYLAMR